MIREIEKREQSQPKRLVQLEVLGQPYATLFTWGLTPSDGYHFALVAYPRSEESRRRHNTMKIFAGKAPSTEGHPKRFAKLQRTASSRSMIRMGRPFDTQPIVPPSLLDEHLNRFRYNVNHIVPQPRDYKTLDALHPLAAQLNNEKTRRIAFSEAIHLICPRGQAPVPQRNGVILAGQTVAPYPNDGQLGAMPFYIQEIKNESVGNSSDPLMQGLLYWINAWAPSFDRLTSLSAIELTEWERTIQFKLHCPVILASHSGEYSPTIVAGTAV